MNICNKFISSEFQSCFKGKSSSNAIYLQYARLLVYYVKTKVHGYTLYSVNIS